MIEALRRVRDRAELHPTYLRLKEWQRLQREQLILDAADQLFVEKGYHDTAIDDIAARVGISKGTVYLHFASKEDLVFALLERGVGQLQATLDEILAAPGTPREKLSAVMRQMCTSMMSRQLLQLGERRWGPGRESAIEQGQLAHQDAHRPGIADDMVHGERHHVDVRCQA